MAKQLFSEVMPDAVKGTVAEKPPAFVRQVFSAESVADVQKLVFAVQTVLREPDAEEPADVFVQECFAVPDRLLYSHR